MKKILYCITKGNFGGAQKYVYDLATHIDKSQYDVMVLCGEGETLPNKLAERGIPVIRMNTMKRDISIVDEFKSMVELYKIFIKEKPDVIHLNSSKMGGIGAFVGRLAGIKNIIFTGHGFAFNEDRSFVSRKLILFFHWLTILLTHKTIIVSKKTMKDIEYLPFMKKKLVQIYNGIDTALDFDSKEDALGILLKDKHDVFVGNKTILLSIGELHKNKGYDLIIPNLKEITKDFIYLIAGEGEERNTIAQAIRDAGLRDKVVLLGRIENAYKYIKAADIFILPSRTEAFPYVLLEAGLAGTAVLASSVGGIPEVVEDDYNGILFDVHDGNDTVHKLNLLIEHGGMREEFARKIHAKVMGDFSLEEMVRETTNFY